MSVIYEKTWRPNLTRYKPEFNADGTEQHEVLDGARFHVLSWSTSGTRCSEPNCEINKHGDLGTALVMRKRAADPVPSQGTTPTTTERT